MPNECPRPSSVHLLGPLREEEFSALCLHPPGTISAFCPAAFSSCCQGQCWVLETKLTGTGRVLRDQREAFGQREVTLERSQS